MKKFKGLFILLLILSVFCFPLKQNISLFAEELEYLSITSLTAVNDMTAKYQLTQDCEISKTLEGTFSGEINGNGHTLTFKNNVCAIFDVLNGAKVYNLKIKFEVGENNQNFTYTLSNKSNQGLFANMIGGNAEVYAIEFNPVTLNLNYAQMDIYLAELNFGLVAGKSSASNIHQIKANNVNIKTFEDAEAEPAVVTQIKSHLNFGFVAGKAFDGTKIQNCNIIDCNLNVNIDDATSAKELNLGEIAGAFDNGYIKNNIVTNENSQNTRITHTNNASNINYGFLVGKTYLQDPTFYSNIVNASAVPNVVDITNYSLGTLVGYATLKIDTKNLSGFYTTLNQKFVGNYENVDNQALESNNFVANFDKNLLQTSMQDSNLWNFNAQWDFNTVWKERNGEVLPALQYFEVFKINFDVAKSLASLEIKDKPQMPEGVNEKVVNATLQSGMVSLTEENNLVPYGASVKITASVTSINNFNKFFEIAGLSLNGEKIYDFESLSLKGYDITHKIQENQVEFTVNGINDLLDGDFSVILKEIAYKMQIKVLDVTENGESFKPGKIKNAGAVDAEFEKNDITLTYGLKYPYETVVDNHDYAYEADWYLGYINPEENFYTFDEETATPAFIGKRNVEFTFNENSNLFGIADNEGDFVSIDQYAEDNIFVVYVLFSRDVQDVQVTFELEDGTKLEEKIVEISIDGNSVEYVDNAFITKIRFNEINSEHIIKITTTSTTYTFVGWNKVTGTGQLEPLTTFGENEGIFYVEKSEDNGTLQLVGVFKETEKDNSGNLLWLWLTLGGVGLILVVVVIIIIIKKKKGDTSYRRHMY